MKIYLSGPITGKKNHEAIFNDWAKRLRAKGYIVVNPVHECRDLIHKCPAVTWTQCMGRLLPMLEKVDAVATLPGWDTSRGALREVEYAKKLGIICADIDFY